VNDIEMRLRTMDLRPPRDLRARALARAATVRARPRWRLASIVLAGVLAILVVGYSLIALATAPRAAAMGVGGYGVGEGCWFVRDGSGLHFHVGGWYRGLPALCTSERDSTPSTSR